MLRLMGKMPYRRLRTIKGWDLAGSFRGSLSQFDLFVHDFPVFLAVESKSCRFLQVALHLLNFSRSLIDSLDLTSFSSCGVSSSSGGGEFRGNC